MDYVAVLLRSDGLQMLRSEGGLGPGGFVNPPVVWPLYPHRQNNGHPEREEIPFRPLLRHGA